MTNRAIRVATVPVIILGMLAAFHAQGHGTARGVPDPTQRIIWALVPHALLIAWLVFLAKSRSEVVLLAVLSAAVWITSHYSDLDELGLILLLAPLLQVCLVGLGMGVLVVRRVRARMHDAGGPGREGSLTMR